MRQRDRAGTFRNLRAWQAGMALAIAVHEFCRTLPASERFCLNDQLRRAAISVPANIAEGHGRGYVGDRARFFTIALGSLRETEALLLIAQEMGLGDAELLTHALGKCERTSADLVALYRALRSLQALPEHA